MRVTSWGRTYGADREYDREYDEGVSTTDTSRDGLAIYDHLPYLTLQVRIRVEVEVGVGVGRAYDETRTIWRVVAYLSPRELEA